MTERLNGNGRAGGEGKEANRRKSGRREEKA